MTILYGLWAHMVSKDLSCTVVLGNMCLLGDQSVISIAKPGSNLSTSKMWTETLPLCKPQSTAPDHPHLSDYKVAQTCLSSWHLLILAYFMVPGLWPMRVSLPCCTLSSCKKNWTLKVRRDCLDCHVFMAQPRWSSPSAIASLAEAYASLFYIFSYYLSRIPLLGARCSWHLYADFILWHWTLPLIN